MSLANPTMASATVVPRPATPVAAGTPSQQPSDPVHAAGHHAAGHDNRPAPAPPAAVPGKKGKQKKTPEPNEASKLIAQRISQLEHDAAGEKDQEADIGGYTSPICRARQIKGDFQRSPFFFSCLWWGDEAGKLLALRCCRWALSAERHVEAANFGICD